MNIIFLDIDGVLISDSYIVERFMKIRRPLSCERRPFDPKCVQQLIDLVFETNAYIVISSTWRVNTDDEMKIDKQWITLMTRLGQCGLSDRVIGYTPRLTWKYNTTCCRGYEIQLWLDKNKHLNIENFVIIDDDSDMFHLKDKLAKCKSNDGITIEVKEKALKIMKHYNKYLL